MAKGKIICNKCGKDFDMFDNSNNFGIHQTLGYGSKYDGSNIDFDMCCSCADKLITHLINICHVNPLVNPE